MAQAGGRAGDDWLSCLAVRTDIARIDAALRAAVTTDDPALTSLAGHLATRGGKRLRPALLFLARGGEPADEVALRAATGVELIHLASLYHDDVMDRSARRRGAETVNARWGNGAAALGGTFLFTRAQRLLAGVGAAATEMAIAASARLCAGQLREAENAYNLELSVTEYLEILQLKTASLFVLAAQLGSLLAGAAPEHQSALADYAGALGLAFQLHDDVLDWVGQQAVMGKAANTDIRGGIYNLPILLLLTNEGRTRAGSCAASSQSTGWRTPTLRRSRLWSHRRASTRPVASPRSRRSAP